MKIYISFLLVSLFLFSCNSFEELIPEPEVTNISADQAALIGQFAELTGGDTSACTLIRDVAEIPAAICQIVQDAQRGSEIVFLVDNTTSMRDDIDQVKANINEIIDCLPNGVRLGAATYSDRNTDDPWFTYTDLSEDYDIARTFINAIELPVTANWDLPESVYDGIYEVLEIMSWQDCRAPDKIIVMGDAAPHTGSLTQYSVKDVLDKAESICEGTEFYPVIVLDL